MQWKDFQKRVQHFSKEEQARIHEAYDLGKQSHGDQKRKSGEPYFTHPVAVAEMLVDLGADPDTIMAALLHDTVEDTPLTLKEIDTQFNGKVAALIDGVTKLSLEDIEGKPTLDEKIETLRKIFTSMEEDVRIMVIKLIDRLHNMQTATFLPIEKQRSYADETMETYVKIANRLSMFDLEMELEGICISILEPDIHKKLEALRTKNIALGKDVIDTMKKGLKKNNGPAVDIQYSRKPWKKLRMQESSNGSTISGVSDVTTAIICKDVAECYEVLGALHQIWRREHLSFQDFVNSPMINGYQGIHTTIILEDGTRVRCKIRTKEMQDYSSNGIATMCFDNEAMGILNYLPWAQRITPLSEDTSDRSEEFWESLQSDILGESIVIHGIDDQTILVPDGANVLDGAFYSYGDKALSLKKVRVNGKEVPLNSLLENGVTIDIDVSNHHTMRVEWLQWANTGLAAAAIRRGLASQSKEKKIKIGMELLQDLLTNQQKGFLEEFEHEKLREALLAIGFASPKKAYIAIAEGRIEPERIYSAMFKDGRQKPTVSDSYKVSFVVTDTSPKKMSHLLEVLWPYQSSSQRISFKNIPESSGLLCSFATSLSQQEKLELNKAIAAAGGSDVEILPRTHTGLALASIVIVLWALNPVLAKWILMDGVAPTTLITVRLLTFCVYTAAFYFVWAMLNFKRFVPIPRTFAPAFLPALGMFALCIYTYHALLTMPPSIHLTIMRFNTLLLPLFYLLSNKGFTQQIFAAGGAFFFMSLGVFFARFPESIYLGLFFSLMSLGSYLYFSLATERNLQEHKIDIRFPAFLFQMGLMLGVMGLVLLFAFPITESASSILTAIAYTLICVCIPYTCYSALLKKFQFKNITTLFLLEVPIAILFEILILSLVLPFYVYPLLGIAVAMLLFKGWITRKRM